MGPLRVSSRNPRYFETPAGRAVHLTGSHTWANLQERTREGRALFDYDAYLDFISRHDHSFMRMWAWEHAAWMQFTDRKILYFPHPYPRTGPGSALDGKPKFDLSRFNDAYFHRLRTRVEAARARDLYVSVMLFQGFSIEQKGTQGIDPAKGNPWDGHPFNRRNNVNGVDGDPDGDGEGAEVHTLAVPEITRLQETYARRVVDTVGDFDNVLFEISNESHGDSIPWQVHMLRLIKEHERTRLMQHPVGMTFPWGGKNSGTNRDLFDSPADWVSPNAAGGYKTDPPPADGRKVIVSDTDHLWGIGGTYEWVWRSFLRGHNPVFMDPYLDVRTGDTLDAAWGPVRTAMGATRRLADRLNLARCLPNGELASSGYCLADTGEAYAVYAPAGEPVTVDLSGARGPLTAEWIDCATGAVRADASVRGGTTREVTAPLDRDAVLYLSAPERQP